MGDLAEYYGIEGELFGDAHDALRRISMKDEEIVDGETALTVIEKPTDLDPYQGVAEKPFPEKAAKVLMAPIDPEDVEIRPDGLIYFPEIKYRRTLNRAFGPGAWALVPRGDHHVEGKTMSRPYALFILGRFVSEARGEQDYVPNNPKMSWATAAEAVKSNAMVRCCKDLGIASECWDPAFIGPWVKKYAVKVWRTKTRNRSGGYGEYQWRRKDRDPFYDEAGNGGQAPEKGGEKTPANSTLPGSTSTNTEEGPRVPFGYGRANRGKLLSNRAQVSDRQLEWFIKVTGEKIEQNPNSRYHETDTRFHADCVAEKKRREGSAPLPAKELDGSAGGGVDPSLTLEELDAELDKLAHQMKKASTQTAIRGMVARMEAIEKRIEVLREQGASVL